MKFISVCSGIEAASAAWNPLGWEVQFFSEIEKFPSGVLEYHYPDVPNLGDMIKFKEWNDYEPDVLVGGTPCQSYSTAGLRKGLDDPRGDLMLTYLAIADRYRPKWLVWENVPGVLSSNKGRDFGTFLGALGELGYGYSFRVLDAQYFGVPQRRRRVFVIGCLGGWRCAGAVLFEQHSLCRYPPPSREAAQVVAGTITRCSFSGGARQAVTVMAHGQGGAEIVVDKSPTITCNHEAPIVFGVPGNWIGRKPENGGNATKPHHNVSPCLTSTDRHAVSFTQDTRSEVRRFTPIEYERLQGFHDNYTRIPWRGKDAESCPDGPRYKALGSSMAVPVMAWIGNRIEMVQALTEN